MSVPVRQFLIAQGIIAAHDIPSAQGEFRIVCPDCQHTSQKCYVNGEGKGVHCFHCKLDQSWRAFQRRYEPPTPQEITMDRYVAICHERLIKDPKMMLWLTDRGLTEDTIKTLKLGFCDNNNMYRPGPIEEELGLGYDGKKWNLGDRLVIPYIRDHICVDMRGREMPGYTPSMLPDQKYVTLPGHKAQPFYPSSIDVDQPTIICEGELDSAILRQHGIQAIGVPGANSSDPRWFDRLKFAYTAFDQDDAGREGLEKLIKKLKEIRRIDLPEGNDVSDYVNNYGIDSFRVLIDRAVLYLYGKPQLDDRWTSIVDSFADWAWTNGALLGPKIPWAPRLEYTFSGWAPGLILIGAEAHMGKSCFIVKAWYQAALDNDDCVSVYLSLDDTKEEAMKRCVSLHTRLDFNLIQSPRWNFDHPTDPNKQRPELLQEYNDGLDSLKDIKNLILRDATFGRSLRYLRSFFESLRTKYPDQKIVVFVDSLAKITADTGDEDDGELGMKGNWKAYLASELKYLTTKHKICLVTPTDLRKMNGTKRPTRDDLKDAAELAYEANIIMLGYNDMKRQGEDKAILKWEENGVSRPVLEWIIDKNKVTGRSPQVIRYYMNGDISEFWEYDADEEKVASDLVRQSEMKAKDKDAA